MADYDFRTLFRRVRATAGWSQQILGELVGLDQSRISAIERDVSRLRDVALVAQIANALRIPPILLGFGGHGTSVGDSTGAPRVVSWVDRRDFVQHIAGLAVGVTGMAALDIDRLTALLPHTDPNSTRYIGAADVAAIEQATAAFVRQDFAHGSGMAHDAAVAHLRGTLPLLNAQATPEVQAQLYLATARLAMQAGWMSFEVNQHDAARRLWMIGLGIARATDHPQSSDLSVYLLYNMAIQAVRLSRPDEAVRLVHLGHTAAAGPRPVSASTISCLASIQALAHAAQGDAPGYDRATGQSIEQFGTIDPATRPPWGAWLTEAGLAGRRGQAHYELAMAKHDRHAADQAVPLLRHAVDRFGVDYARLRALSLPDLSGAHALAGDIDTAVAVGHQAIDAITTLHSPRAYDRLQVLNTALEPLHTSTGVAELRDRLTTTAA